VEVFTLEGFATFLTHCAEKGKQSHLGLELCAQIVEASAKEEIGEYQGEVGAFPAWAPLVESTVEEKERLGYAPPDNPLWRTGELKESISHEVENDEAVIGSDSEIMVYHEFGTSKMAMRPVLGPALAKNLEVIGAILGKFTTGGFVKETLTRTLPNGQEAILERMVKVHGSLGYGGNYWGPGF
jgi:phage gpG-like protein